MPVANYRAYYQAKLESSFEFQDYVIDVVHDHLKLSLPVYSSKLYQFQKGESPVGVEIKHDEKMASTGNLYIETAEKSDPANVDYVVSGIYRSAWLWIIGDRETIYLIDTKKLRKFDQWQEAGEKILRHVETPTSRGYLLPCKTAEEHAMHVVRPTTERT